ncbi:hypothetical protein EVAR_43153_1 [Eumeta japonica]|uniref:Uncharacterized protein n=1 Tax=Eumeta variegata TaxID=151549 RepID=A0A4C1XKE3_EUMVA|nr:hypothetical protein EVAR_43153_1 [Eumeta japonica]
MHWRGGVVIEREGMREEKKEGEREIDLIQTRCEGTTPIGVRGASTAPATTATPGAGGGGRLAPCRCIRKVTRQMGGNNQRGRTSRKAHRSHEELGGVTADQRETSATGGVLGEVLHRRDWHSARDLRHAPPHTPPRTRHCTHGGAGAPTPERSKRRELTADRAVSSIPDVSPRSTFYIGDATVPSSAAAPDDSRPASPTPASIQLVEYEDHDQGTRYLYSGRAIDGKAPDEEWRSVAESRGRLASEGDALSACARPASAAFSGVSIDIR